MQKKKMVTSLLVAGAILVTSFSSFADAAISDIAKEPVVISQKIYTKAISEHKISSTKQVTVKKSSVESKKYAAASETKNKKKVTKRKMKRSKISRSRGGNSIQTRKLIEFAKKQLGKPYVWGAMGPNSFDCSGFTTYVYANIGVGLPHSSMAQSKYGTKVSRSEIQPGDLLFFATGGSSSINHVGIYIGGDEFIHGSSGRGKVYISDLSNYTKYAGEFITAQRIL